jgi:uncharacterized sodium:solute symporter family permease YidK
MRAFIGFLAYMAVVFIAVIMLVSESIKRRKKDFKYKEADDISLMSD